MIYKTQNYYFKSTIKLLSKLENVIAVPCLIGFIFEAKIYRFPKVIGEGSKSCFPDILGDKECDQLTNGRRMVTVKGV